MFEWGGKKKKKQQHLNTSKLTNFWILPRIGFPAITRPKSKSPAEMVENKRNKHAWWQEVPPPSSVPSECTSRRQQSFAADVASTNFSSTVHFPRHPFLHPHSFILALSHRLLWRHESQWNEVTVAAWWEAWVKMCVCVCGARSGWGGGEGFAVASMLPYVGFTVSHFNDAYSSSETAVVHSSI